MVVQARQGLSLIREQIALHLLTNLFPPSSFQMSDWHSGTKGRCKSFGNIFITTAWRRDWKHSHSSFESIQVGGVWKGQCYFETRTMCWICAIKWKGAEISTTKLKGEGKGVGEIGKIKSFLIRRDLETGVCSEDFVYFDYNQFVMTISDWFVCGKITHVAWM